MEIECIYNRLNEIQDLGTRETLKRYFGSNEESLGLTVGKKYVVYANERRNNDDWYFITDDDYGGVRLYPMAYSSAFFRVVDSRPSSYWANAISENSFLEDGKSLMAFDEWDDDPGFYERLVDGGDVETQIFLKYRGLMDLEFLSSDVVEAAEAVDGTWLLCPKCGDAWETDSVFGMVECSRCGVKLANPRRVS
jgi:hypothetical protein